MALLIQSPEVTFTPCYLRETPSRIYSNTELRKVQSHVIVNNGGKGIRFKISSRIKDSDARVSNLERNIVDFYGQFSAPVKPTVTSPPMQKKEDEEEKQNYYVNTGYAIRTLREEFPAIFYRELTLDIYRNDIVFKDPLNTFSGIDNYKTIFWALRFHGKIFFRALWIDILSVWQPGENIIMIRWTVHGIPRIPWESHGRFDGTSEYKLDKNGKIYEHRVHNIALNEPPKFRVAAVEELIQSLGCPSTPKPTYFEISSSSASSSIIPLLGTCSSLQPYPASPSTSDQSSQAESSRT